MLVTTSAISFVQICIEIDSCSIEIQAMKKKKKLHQSVVTGHLCDLKSKQVAQQH